jgi:hypothetical protein
MSFTFEPEPRPFPQWMGPFSPARGIKSGFRFHEGRLGTWVSTQTGNAFWQTVDCQGARSIASLVRAEWGGGRVLLLANGFVIKPLQDEEVGRRVLIGRFHGSIVLARPNQSTFDLSRPGNLTPGDVWPGPSTTGLECAIQQNGSLICSWYHPTPLGRDEISEQLHDSDSSLAAGFRRARPGNHGGRIRVTANGHVITNRQDENGDWRTIYVGRIDPTNWANWQRWIEREHR